MCEICRQMPCHPRCPNYDPSPWTVYKCAWCGEGILDGEEYIETNKGQIHYDCVSEMTTRELLKELDVEVETASLDI